MRGTLALLAALAVTALAPAPAGAAPLVGTQDGGVLSASESVSAITAEVQSMARLKGQVARFEVSWAALEPKAQGERDPAVIALIDAYVDTAARHGIRPILYIDRTPCWASSAPDDLRQGCRGADRNRAEIWRYAPADAASAVPVSAFLAQRYGTRLAAFQLWNEPDHVNQKYWAGPDKLRRYVAFAKAVYPAVKAVAPDVPVLAGSFVGPDGRWLKALYDAGLKGSYDGLSVQFYDLPLNALRRTRQVQLAHGDTTPLWLTEFGYTSCAGANGRPSWLADHPCVTAKVQAQNLEDVFAATARTSWLAAAVVYAFHDETTAYQFGALDRRGKRKPAYAVLGRAARHASGPYRAPVLHLRRGGGVVRASGSAPGIDLYTLRIKVHGTLRYRASVRPDRFNRFSVKLPPVVGTTGLTATLTRQWDGRRYAAKRR
ncbi:MAG: glycoside hydrolase family 5 protein [Conexibacter sp.]|nr:glycoside hydrolase family 5 protein [Conexibacter sp.]